MIIAKKVRGALFDRSVRVRPELAVECGPDQPNGPLEADGPVIDPLLQVEAERGAREGLQDVHVQRDWVVDDFVEKFLAQPD